MGARWLYMLPALLLSIVAVILALVGLSREPSPPPEGGGVVMQVAEEEGREELQHSYWVATRELNIGNTINEDDVREVSVSVPLAQAVPVDEDVSGSLLRRNVREGEILSKTHLEAGNRLAQSVPAGYRAFAMGIDNVIAVGGLVQPGDLVDVVAHFRSGQDRKPSSLILLSSIEVLAVNGQLEDAFEQDEDGRDARRSRNATVVLAVPREDLTRLLVADANGTLRLAMAGEARRREKGADEPDQVDTTTVTTKLEELFPRKKAPAKRPAPSPGEKVEVYEGSTSRSTYVH